MPIMHLDHATRQLEVFKADYIAAKHRGWIHIDLI